ncbi:MAG TPA: G1 family glutamic endopeptidase [Solirubrobacteraceae bacterium]|nr:G1 family glutamic endopeptidase [Solirubrobacteraceae bacterium]
MKLNRAIPILAATAACALGVVPAASAATDVQQASSENWAGYVVGGSGSSGQQFKSVSGSWVAPTASCTSGPGYSAFWVGLGGSGQSNSLEQAGTEADCSASGTPSYFAWYELVPQAPVKVNLAVHPGDHISSKVTVEGSNVTISLSDQTTGASFSKTLRMSSPDVSSAEWVAEAPSSCDQTVSNCSPLSLADFGKVQFTNASATSINGHTGTISDPNWSAAAVTLSPSALNQGFAGYPVASANGSGGAAPSALSSDGSSFSVTWTADQSGATPTSGSAGSGYPGGGYSGYPGGGYSGYPGGGYSGYPGGGYSGYPGYGAYPGYGSGGGLGSGVYIYVPYYIRPPRTTEPHRAAAHSGRRSGPLDGRSRRAAQRTGHESQRGGLACLSARCAAATTDLRLRPACS